MVLCVTRADLGSDFVNPKLGFYTGLRRALEEAKDTFAMPMFGFTLCSGRRGGGSLGSFLFGRIFVDGRMDFVVRSVESKFIPVKRLGFVGRWLVG